MSTNLDYDGAAKAIWRVIGEVPSRVLGEGSIYEVAAHAAVDAALGGDPIAWAVDALIAEGGEIRDTFRGSIWTRDLEPGRYLVYGPIPAEEETAT